MNTTAEKVADGLADYLRDAFGRSGDVEVFTAPDPATGLELLAGGRPKGDGDEPADEAGPAGDTLVSARLTVGVAGHPGLSAPETRKAPGALAFSGEVRAAVCMAEPEGVFGGYEYRGMSQVRDMEGAVMRGYALSFAATYAFAIPESEEW